MSAKRGMTMSTTTIDAAVQELIGARPGTTIELHRPTGHYSIRVRQDGSIASQCRGSDGRLRPPTVEYRPPSVTATEPLG
jgi:hypothetical protein